MEDREECVSIPVPAAVSRRSRVQIGEIRSAGIAMCSSVFHGEKREVLSDGMVTLDEQDLAPLLQPLPRPELPSVFLDPFAPRQRG